MSDLVNRVGKKVLVHLGAFISVIIVCLALWVMYNTLQTISLSDVINNLGKLSITSVFLAFVITALSYFIVTGYDVVALRHIRRRIPYSRAALSAFLASTFGNNIGFAILTGTSIRYRIYSLVGLSGLEIAGVSTMCALTTTLGMGFIFSIAMLLQPADVAQSNIPIPPEFMRYAGGLVLTAMFGYLIFITIKPITLHTQNWSLRLPSAQTTLSQIALATGNLALVATLIYVLLPEQTDISYIQFLSVFALAIIAGSASNVPGGIGVFESVLLLGLPQISPAALLGSIILFRCVYYLTPLVVAATVLAVHEATQQREKLEGIQERTTDWLDEIGPHIMAFIVVLAGTVLLFTNAIPHFQDRSSSPAFIPLFIVEFAYLTAAGMGVSLILLAHSISQRLDEAYRLTVTALAIGIVACLLRAFDFQEAIILGLLLLLIVYTRPEFYRKTAIFDQGYPDEWISLFAVIIAVSIWIGLFSYKGIQYSYDLWWYFDYQGEYSRFLRSLLMIGLVSFAFTVVNFSHPEPDTEVVRQQRKGIILKILEKETRTRPNLVLLADKRVLFNESENAFIMYQVQKKSWIALSDPVGPEQEHSNLVWQFMGLCARYQGIPVFYQVGKSNRSKYIDLGLALIHLGDDARVPLQDIDRKSNKRQELLEIHQQVQSQGLKFEVITQNQVAKSITELQQVSDQWLDQHNSKELGFSRGHFDPQYLVYFPFAMIRKNGELIAFANIWTSADKNEISIDLMRHNDQVPKGIMDYLYIELMLWGHEQGYHWFNLGLAPLASLEGNPLEPLWSRIGKFLYRQGEHFKNFDNLRHFEEQYEPIWKPKYLALPGGVNTAKVFLDIAKLTAQGNPV